MATKKELIKMSPAELADLVIALENKVSEQKGIIEEMNSQIDSNSKNPTQKAMVKVAGKQYEIVYKSFSHNKKVVSVADVQADAKLASELVEMGSGALKLIEE